MLKTLVLAVLLLCIQYSHAEDNVITIGYGEAYKPFSWNENGVAVGIQADVVQEVLVNQMGLKVVHIACPWRRCQQLVQSGEIDGFFTVPTAERETYTVKTAIPFYHTNFVMHTAKTNPNITKFQSVTGVEDILKLKNILHVNMLGSGWHAQELKHAAQRIEVPDALMIPKMLVLRRADLYIEQAEMFRYQAKSLGFLDEIVTLPRPVIHTMPWHLFINIASPNAVLMTKINQHLLRLQQSGELDNIRRNAFDRHGVQ